MLTLKERDELERYEYSKMRNRKAADKVLSAYFLVFVVIPFWVVAWYLFG